jgi:hypothetical protein
LHTDGACSVELDPFKETSMMEVMKAFGLHDWAIVGLHQHLLGEYFLLAILPLYP